MPDTPEIGIHKASAFSTFAPPPSDWNRREVLLTAFYTTAPCLSSESAPPVSFPPPGYALWRKLHSASLFRLSKSNPLRWASIWFWAQSRKKIDLTHLLQHVLIKICTAKTPHENAVFLCQYEKAEKIYAGKLKSKI